MECEQFQQRMTIPTWPAASGILQICQFLICSRLLWENDSASYVENYLSHLLWADNKGDDHQHQAVPHVQHQANLVKDTNDDGDNKKDKDDDDGDTAAAAADDDDDADDDYDGDGRPQ